MLQTRRPRSAAKWRLTERCCNRFCWSEELQALQARLRAAVRAPEPAPPPPPLAAAADAAAAPALRAIVASHRAAFRERAGAAGAERPAASQDGAGPAAVAAALLLARDAGAPWRAGAPVSAGQHVRGVGSDSDALHDDTAGGRAGEAGADAHAAEDVGRAGVERASSAPEVADGPRGGPPRRRRRLQAGGEPAAAQAAAAGCAHRDIFCSLPDSCFAHCVR